MPTTLKHAVCFVAVANLAYFGIEFAVALNIGSVSLFADSIDFLEDAAVNLLILVALRWNASYAPSPMTSPDTSFRTAVTSSRWTGPGNCSTCCCPSS